jgi:predicted transcriptional regulator
MATPLFVSTVRHSILEMAPLELDCMNALWPLGEATVRDIQLAMAVTKPRAYTTIMTILDRLAQKGVVQRHKRGRAWLYSANLSEEEARSRAITQLVDGFFGGSTEALAGHLAMRGPNVIRTETPREPLTMPRPAIVPRRETQGTAAQPTDERPVTAEKEEVKPREHSPAQLDTTLL